MHHFVAEKLEYNVPLPLYYRGPPAPRECQVNSFEFYVSYIARSRRRFTFQNSSIKCPFYYPNPIGLCHLSYLHKGMSFLSLDANVWNCPLLSVLSSALMRAYTNTGEHTPTRRQSAWKTEHLQGKRNIHDRLQGDHVAVWMQILINGPNLSLTSGSGNVLPESTLNLIRI